MDGEHDGDELLLTDVADEGGDEDGHAGDQHDDGDVEIEVEGEEQVDETPLQKHLRDQIRIRDRELAELRKGQHRAPVDAGPKPTIDEFDYDQDKFDEAYDAWAERKRQANEAQTTTQAQTQAAADKFERSRIAYQAKAQVLGVKNFQSAEDRVKDTLGADYLGWIVQYADEPVKLVAALGQNPHLLDSIADEPDPMLRLKKLLRMETKVTVKRKAPPPPEADTIQRGSAPLAAVSADKQAEKLLEKAGRTGNMTEYNRYMKAQREKAK